MLQPENIPDPGNDPLPRVSIAPDGIPTPGPDEGKESHTGTSGSAPLPERPERPLSEINGATVRGILVQIHRRMDKFNYDGCFEKLDGEPREFLHVLTRLLDAQKILLAMEARQEAQGLKDGVTETGINRAETQLYLL